ncbi:NAD(P)/FAD-dependent oxidoreductase [Halegenticoccus tardaugens]|uniref:NAD(P)/FAD-dependent oxidoreductase n=1 Tax=Halegenticoccus tardaugens TaxID=2071624 RepID=UPI00100B435F|nr:FAD-dependent oxidoreductase [Halegenticoccus tardaugens]
MAHVAIVGGGPAGLSTALFAAKNGLETTVFDTDETAMHYAHLFNYPAVESIGGDEFVERARAQIEEYGAERREEEVTAIETNGSGFVVKTDDGGIAADYVVLASGQSRGLADGLGCDRNDDGTVRVDVNMRTGVDGVYAAGWVARKDKVQAAISVGDGAAAALDILSAEKGKPFHDFDTPESVE